jgi:hypothetical protein
MINEKIIKYVFLRHALPLFTSLLNIVFSYDPVGYGLPYNYLMFTDSRENLVEVSCQILCVILESNIPFSREGVMENTNGELIDERNPEISSNSNLFISYISRIHRDEVLTIILLNSIKFKGL